MNISSISITYTNLTNFNDADYALSQCIEDDVTFTSDESTLTHFLSSTNDVNDLFESLYVSYLDGDDTISSFTVNVKK